MLEQNTGELELAVAAQLQEMRDQRDQALKRGHDFAARRWQGRIEALESELASLIKRGTRR
ncbi:hypothetical protein QP568_08035 [Propionimicrobium lymphophilum]|uniref:hypothetical protein n=1 Tax=Propionimicrobium lymphophilum TaxID=33012 RepID=UPI00254D4FE1|nr:hypothetical protein [Propionimicrobium lymphophilum]MDK7710218.1 hypothetical protein [Propionimicrobium lymphophilum]MDK7734233.1 hypothetical protein [Propionimicrobium lymphophilum]